MFRVFLGPAISTDGRWLHPLPSGGNIFLPDRDAPGDYTYLVESPAGCTGDSALLRVRVAYPPELGPDTTICLLAWSNRDCCPMPSLNR